MKLLNQLTALLITTSILIVACKSKSPKELIVNKWTMTNISGKGSNMITDSMKNAMYGKASIEFMKDGRFEVSQMGNQPTKGTYSITDDGKYLVTTDDGKTMADSLVVMDLTSAKLDVNIKKEDISMTFKSK